jgi:hypothetical protein
MTKITATADRGKWTCCECGQRFEGHPEDHLLECPGIDEDLRDHMIRKRAELERLQAGNIEWVRDLHDRMVQLARLFPCFRDRIDERSLFVNGWDAKELDGFACSAAVTSGSLHAARFLVALWSGRAYDYPKRRPYTRVIRRFDCGVFDIVDAMGSWDPTHRAAFCAWSRDPWWP